MYQSTLQCDVCIPNHLVTRPVTTGGGLRPLEKLSPPLKKCLGHIACITSVLVHAFDVIFVPPSEYYSPLLVSKAGYGSAGDCCLVTSVS